MRGRATSSGGIGGAVAAAMVWFIVGCGGETAKAEGAGESAPTGGTSGTSGSQDASAPVVNLANVDAGRTVVVAVGQQIDITLQSIGPGRYGPPNISSSAVRFVDVSYPGPIIPALATPLFRFEAVSAGEAIIRIEHTGRLPEMGQLPPFTITIVVE